LTDNEVRHMDQEFEDKGVRLVVDMKYLYLAGTGAGLPMASTANFSSITPTPPASGCGESFR
jgi:iron-sulfur cluster assembly protein